MKFVNHWAYVLGADLPAGGTALPIPNPALARLGLANGDRCTLVITGSFNPLSQVAEVIVAVGTTGGSVNLVRGAEGTVAQSWPAGALVYAPVTAGHMTGIQNQLASLLSRIEALEHGGGGDMPEGALVDGLGNYLVDGQGNYLVKEA
ncbi:hypothetical protein CDR19_25060 [Ectopseudomonas toyotomiensis]|uniref:Uncharacterized protein n=1 Tax=Ectopseudomonas toyotomiensis TaxID=554344 RepID=A0A1I5WZF9_9GAMM|nr:hypothetical protein [Pseudomonas toyotomiensis]PIA66360.1 hypothetical protein CDR19_25060 [Pseudomonas toyotomiensis]SFQ24887.1 hypothetical protein SAMN05216177_109248 [Pseudomonas toyotomiensis]SFQ45892.1 hypothetical protein SAMN05216177_11528 [Pseudomonas toyotomiensis]